MIGSIQKCRVLLARYAPLGYLCELIGPTQLVMNEAPRGLIDIRDVLSYIASDRYMGKAGPAEYLGLSVRTLEARKDIPRFQLQGEAGKGGKVLFKKSAVDGIEPRCERRAAGSREDCRGSAEGSLWAEVIINQKFRK